jgi:hypothetical protein
MPQRPSALQATRAEPEEIRRYDAPVRTEELTD